eukprot:TRINITY_DN80399_c0_g1_i1.p2 TRINITY_DN80399_c0_g1~~TRINITY_DN80399_c0_g1_i1.p2  ORF type:complete len:104 (-),score=17.96 TRINITY_DN80399_c0_g1_i1:49-360(-)
MSASEKEKEKEKKREEERREEERKALAKKRFGAAAGSMTVTNKSITGKSTSPAGAATKGKGAPRPPLVSQSSVIDDIVSGLKSGVSFMHRRNLRIKRREDKKP